VENAYWKKLPNFVQNQEKKPKYEQHAKLELTKKNAKL